MTKTNKTNVIFPHPIQNDYLVARLCPQGGNFSHVNH